MHPVVLSSGPSVTKASLGLPTAVMVEARELFDELALLAVVEVLELNGDGLLDDAQRGLIFERLFKGPGRLASSYEVFRLSYRGPRSTGCVEIWQTEGPHFADPRCVELSDGRQLWPAEGSVFPVLSMRV